MLKFSLFIGLAIGGAYVTWRGSSLLEKSSQLLSEYYHIPSIVEGGVILAVASSFPELSSVIIATLVHGKFELGVSAVVGSAIFNILAIPAICTLKVKSMKVSRDLVYKESLFYLLSISVLFLIFAFSVIFNPLTNEFFVGQLTPWMALIPICVYGLYIFLQYQETSNSKKANYKSNLKRPGIHWLKLLLGLFLITVGVEGLIRSAEGLGLLFNSPSFLWGLLIIAVGTSLPDTFVSIRAAEEFRTVASLSNVLGSNIFDLLIAIPVGVLIAGSAKLNFYSASIMMSFLILATVILFTIMRTKFELTMKEAYVLLFSNGIFVLWVILETLEVSKLI